MIDILEKRYSNVQILISAFMTKFVQLPKIRSSNNASNLRKIYDEIEFSVQNLKSLKVETGSNGSLLVHLLNEKLRNDIRFDLARKFKDDVWKLDDMLIFLKTEIEAKEISISVGFSTDSSRYKNSHQSYSASALLTHASKKACPFCNLANHSVSKCLKVANPNI